MALNLNSGDFKPFVKYNAKAGRWSIRKDKADVEVQNPVFVADFEGIRTGYFYFRDGAAPEKILDPSLTQMAPKPDKTYIDTKDGNKVKPCFIRGFELNLYSPSNFGGLVEFSATAGVTCQAINELHSLYEAGLKENPGKLPVVEVKGSEAIKGDYGTNYKPLFVIQKWIDRPNDMKVGAQAPAVGAAVGTVIGTTSVNQNVATQAPQGKVASDF